MESDVAGVELDVYMEIELEDLDEDQSKQCTYLGGSQWPHAHGWAGLDGARAATSSLTRVFQMVPVCKRWRSRRMLERWRIGDVGYELLRLGHFTARGDRTN